MKRTKIRAGWMPKTQLGKTALVLGAVLIIAGSAYYAGYSAQRVDKAADLFVQKYQHIDQRPYRTQI